MSLNASIQKKRMSFKFRQAFHPQYDEFWVFVSLFLGGLVFVWLPQVAESSRSQVVELAVMVSVTVMGFLIASFSILLAISDRDAIIKLKKSGHYQNLASHTFVTAGLFLVVVLVGFSYFLLDGHSLLKLTLGTFVVSVVNVMRVFQKFRIATSLI